MAKAYRNDQLSQRKALAIGVFALISGVYKQISTNFVSSDFAQKLPTIVVF